MRKLINQPFFIRCLMSLALLLMPLGIIAQNNVIFPVLKYTNPTIQANMVEVSEWTIKWSARNGTYPDLYNPNQLSGIVYTSSSTDVATVDDKGSITPVAPGSTTITASFAGDGIYEPASASYTLTYDDDRNDVKDLGFGFSAATADAIYGDATVNAPTLSMGKLAGAKIKYSSSATDVAIVDETSGAVTIKGVGETVVKASFDGDDDTKPGSTSYTLTVSQKEVKLTWGETSFTYDGNTHVPMATATGLVGSDACIVTVTGEQTNAGNYTATASALSNNNYKLPADNTKAFSISKADATVIFSSKTVDAKMGASFTAPTATSNPAGLTLTYSSSATSVATVDVSTGAVTLVAEGSTTITATFAGNNNYNTASDSYTLTVAKADAVSSELSFASETAIATYGDASVASPALSNPHQLPLTWSSSKEEVAMVNASGVVTIVGAGETVISAAFAGNDTYTAKTISYTLTVNKFQPTIVFSTMSVTAKIGEEFIPPKVTTNPKDLELVYSSTDETVATVDANTGEVKLLGIGTTKIKAVYTATHNYHYVSSYYDLKVSLLDPIEENKDYTMDEKFFVNPDGSEVDLTGHVVNDIFFTLKNTSSPEGDGYDTEGHSIVINTVTAPSVVDGLLADGVEPGLPEFTEKFTGLTFLVTAGTGEIIVNSQEANGYHLMVQVGNDEPVSIYQTERGDYSIPYERDHPTYVYVYNGGTDVVGGSTRGKKSAINVRVYSVSYKGKGSSAIRQVYSEQLDEDRWYDLNGRLITAPTKKGIYINGNRKVVIR